MKTLFLIFLCLFSTTVFSQNYRTANTTQTTYYSETMDWQTLNVPFKANSFDVQGNGDTVIYFLERLNPTVFLDTVQMCIDTASTPWQGEKILLQSNGMDIYYNKNNEPIVINTQANLGESWFLFDGDIKVEATISNVVYQTFFGIMDSTKTFSVQVFNSINTPIAHPLNGQNFEFSQNFGFIIAPNFHHFPSDVKHYLKGVQHPKLNIYNITRNDVYNFEVGDEFHIETGTMFSKDYYQVFILSKQLDANNNWEYTYDVARHVFWDYDLDKDSVSVGELTGFMPEQLIPQSHTDLSPLPMIFHQDSSSIGGYVMLDKSNTYNKVQKIIDSGYWTNNGSCWGQGFISHSPPNIYMEGLGGPYGGSPISGNGFTATLVHYKKGNEIYGTPIDFDEILPTKNIINKNNNLKLYPNPATDFITLEWLNQTTDNFKILIFNNLGQLIESDMRVQNPQQINIQHLPKGIYTIRIENEKTVYIKQFVKQ